MTTKRKKPVVLVGRVEVDAIKEFRDGWGLKVYPLKYSRKGIDIRVKITIVEEK